MPVPYRVAVIGSTNRGNYGHGLDVVWKQLPETEIVAVADDHPEGLARAATRLGATHAYLDYRTMLEAIQPDLVSIAPRWVDQHCDMVVAAAQAGVKGIYLEKPLCRSMEEADAMELACTQANTKVAVAHQTRYSPILRSVYRLIHEGHLGDIMEIHARGKDDHRGGVEDLWVLGTHVLDLMHHLGGAPNWCSGSILESTRLVTNKDIRPGNEGLGPFAGNQVHAIYGLENGILGYFSSRANTAANPSRFGITIRGSEGLLTMGTGFLPAAHYLASSDWQNHGRNLPWTPVSSGGMGQPESLENGGLQEGNRIACKDLIASIEDDRAPESSLREAMVATEMILAILESHSLGQRVHFPLENRKHPLNVPFRASNLPQAPKRP